MINPFDMSGRTILVTGASSGIGRATALLLSQLGARVILVARNQTKLEETMALLEGQGHVIENRDLGNYADLATWMRGLASAHGLMDGIVHSAGIEVVAPLKIMDPAQVEQEWRINVMAELWLTKGFRQRGVNRSGGSIVLISSVAGLIGQTALSAYSASKGAVIAMTRSLAMELARENIRVNGIAPGNLKHEMVHVLGVRLAPENWDEVEKDHPLGFGEPMDIANAAAFLLAPAARWITGTTLVVDGGYTAH